ncbi:MAG: sigma-70 family RNA polymerase sigma factor [Clostridiales bacterium]|nr:sigma-70 family RNA polymerase sigma factor [Clostridiales bacterium]
MTEERYVQTFKKYAETRDRQLRDELFEAFMPLCASIAGKFTGRGAAREDLEQVAGIALLKALERYEPDRNLRFVTYAVPTITGEVRNYLRDKGSLMRMPRNSRQQLYQMTQAQERFEQEHRRTPSARELAEYMGISQDELLALLNVRHQTDMVSLDAPVGEEDEIGLEAFMGQSEAGFERVEQGQWMQWALSMVTEQEKTVLLLRFQEQLNQRDTAQHMGVSQMQVSRLERRALDKLRKLSSEYHL